MSKPYQSKWCQPCRPSSCLQMNPCAASLPPELWAKVWDGLDKGFCPTGHEEIHMAGTCKCGKLKFKVDGTLAAAFFCHCHMCRKYWSQTVPTETLWVQPATAVSITEGEENYTSWTVEKLSRNLRGEGHVHFAKCCGTPINVRFSDPMGGNPFTLMWPYNFTYDEWGDTSGKGDKARHGYSQLFVPRFHAHYENRSVNATDDLPKLADIWLEGMEWMNTEGEVIGKVTYPVPGFEKGFAAAPVASSGAGAVPPPPIDPENSKTRKEVLEALSTALKAVAKL